MRDLRVAINPLRTEEFIARRLLSLHPAIIYLHCCHNRMRNPQDARAQTSQLDWMLEIHSLISASRSRLRLLEQEKCSSRMPQCQHIILVKLHRGELLQSRTHRSALCQSNWNSALQIFVTDFSRAPSRRSRALRRLLSDDQWMTYDYTVPLWHTVSEKGHEDFTADSPASPDYSDSGRSRFAFVLPV